MSIYGYHRTSTNEQHLDRGITAIKNYCKTNNIELDEIFTDKQTGKNFNRPDYLTLKRMARKKGDVIIISELDRLGRDKIDTLKELKDFTDKGIRVMILEIPTTLVDYGAMEDTMANMIMQTINNMLIEMYATFAHAEMVKRSKRQTEGIQAKKDRGDWDNYGRPHVIDFAVFEEAYNKVINMEERPVDCMRKLGMTSPTFYRYAKIYKNKLCVLVHSLLC